MNKPMPMMKNDGRRSSEMSPRRFKAHDAMLERYMRDIRRHPLLTLEEERELTTAFAATRDPVIGQRLVDANLRLVARIAFFHGRQRNDILDLIQEGNVGLLQAVQRFDPSRGVRLSSFAAWWVRAYMLRYILNNHCMVRFGTTQKQRQLFFNFKKPIHRLGEEATDERLAQELGVSMEQVGELRGRLSHEQPLHAIPGRSRALEDELATDESSRPDVQAEQHQFTAMLHQQLKAFSSTLQGREEIVFDERLLAEQPRPLREIGRSFGVSRERVRQVELSLRERLRAHLGRELAGAV